MFRKISNRLKLGWMDPYIMYIKQQLWNIPREFYYGLKTWVFLSDAWCNKNIVTLTHWGLVMPYDIGDLGQHWLNFMPGLHVMACCLMVSSHYLNQYWLITTEVLRWYSPGCSFTGNVEDIYLPLICIWKLLIKITAAYSRWGWVNCFMLIGSLHMRFSGPPIVDYSLFIIIQRYIG